MIPNGIYVRNSLDNLVVELSGNLRGLKKMENGGNLPSDHTGFSGKVVVLLDDVGENWCRVQTTGDPDGKAFFTEFLTGNKFLEKVMVWDCDYEASEYNYSFFEGGKLMEQFSLRGPALEAVNFVSELRHVQLKDMVNGQDFAEDAFAKLVINKNWSKEEGSRQLRFDFSLPPKRSKWKSLLGILAGGE